MNYLSYDIGVLSNNNKNYWTGRDERFTSKITSIGTVLTGLSSSLYGYYLMTPSASEMWCYTGNVCVEFDVVSVTEPNNIRPQLTDGTNTSTFYLDVLGVSGESHIKIVVSNSYVDWYVNGAVNPVKHDAVTFNGAYACGFRGKYASVFKFRNYVVYSI